MSGKNKGGREVRKPKQEKKPKTVEAPAVTTKATPKKPK
jgi:hypothetical protein